MNWLHQVIIIYVCNNQLDHSADDAQKMDLVKVSSTQ